VAVPGFDLRGGGGRGLCQRRGGRKSLKTLKVEVKDIFGVFWPHFITTLLKLFASEESDEKNEKI